MEQSPRHSRLDYSQTMNEKSHRVSGEDGGAGWVSARSSPAPKTAAAYRRRRPRLATYRICDIDVLSARRRRSPHARACAARCLARRRSHAGALRKPRLKALTFAPESS